MVDSVNSILDRPLYSSLARAYDLIIAGPVSNRCDFVQNMLTRRDILPGSPILDAGCGTGSYSVELAKRGYAVSGLDASADLISVAGEKAEKGGVSVTFETGDILELPSRPNYDGILCRGVLNDIIGRSNRQRALFSLVNALAGHGILILDVREWSASVLRKEKEPVFEKSVETNEGLLTFRSVTRLDKKNRRLCIAESYIVEQGDTPGIKMEYDFVMQCWTRDELHDSLTNAGIASVTYFGDYNTGCAAGSTDRIIAVASI